MKILLTGSTGMLGKNILEHPEAAKYQWITPPRSELDLRKQSDVSTYVQKHLPDLVIHAAGVVGGIQANIKEPVKFFVDNLDVGRNIIMAARESGVENFLNLSCSCMYPRMAPIPMQESSILTGELEPTNEGYALAKISAQRLCEYISRENNSFQYKTLVASNLYGRFDKFDPKHAHMIPAVIVKLDQARRKNLAEIDIWGDGKATREFMYAGDFADCIFAAVSNFSKLPALANVGPGAEVSINEYYQEISKVVGYSGRFVHDLTKPSGMARKLVDTSKMTAWGWTAKTSLQDGLKAAYQFYLKQENLL